MNAAPYTPPSDSQVIETLPARRADPVNERQRELTQAWRRSPRDPGAAAALADHHVQRSIAEGDPRYVGYAQATLAPWWDEPAPPVPVRLVRAVVKQYVHAFDDAVSDLQSIVREQPRHAPAWSWLAAIALVQARYDDARGACSAWAAVAGDADDRLAATACGATVAGLTGQGASAVDTLRAALAQAPSASPELRLWVLTRLAEAEERLGRWPAAEAAYRQAQALGLQDNYLLAAHADFLLDRGRPGEVLALLKGRGASDTLLLRLALAAKAAGTAGGADAARWQRDLAARFDAARRRGAASHEKEEARFLLAFGGDVQQAVALARANFEVQREPSDARVLLEAALAARDPAAAGPVLRWMAESRIESVTLQDLAARLPQPKEAR